jgi:hypothetical protein
MKYTITWSQWISDDDLENCRNERARRRYANEALQDWMGSPIKCTRIHMSRRSRDGAWYRVTICAGKQVSIDIKAEIPNAIIRRRLTRG